MYMFDQVKDIKRLLKLKYSKSLNPDEVLSVCEIDSWKSIADCFAELDERKAKAMVTVNSALIDAFFTLAAKLAITAFGLLLLFKAIGEYYV